MDNERAAIIDVLREKDELIRALEQENKRLRDELSWVIEKLKYA